MPEPTMRTPDTSPRGPLPPSPFGHGLTERDRLTHRRRLQIVRGRATELVQAQRLDRLDLSCRQPTKQNLSIVSNALQGNRIVELDLGGMALNPPDVEKLAKALSGNASLTSLNLQSCGIDTTALRRLGTALRAATALHTLHLGDARAEGAGEILADFIGTHPGLSSLDLSWSILDEADLCELFNALQPSASPHLIRLRGIPISRDATAALSAALCRAADSLIAVDLSGCSIDGVDVDRLLEAISIGGQMVFQLDDVTLSPQQSSKLDQSLMSNLRRSTATLHLSHCMAASGKHMTPDICAEILRRIPLDVDGLKTLISLRAVPTCG